MDREYELPGYVIETRGVIRLAIASCLMALPDGTMQVVVIVTSLQGHGR
jgi:hypothetical protein